MVLVGCDAEVYGFDWFRCGDVWFWLVPMWRCIVLIGFVKGTYVFGWFL